MYLAHFDLGRDPFSMTPDPSLLYLTHGHREALAAITYTILSRKGFVVLTGDAGTGKTTLIAKVIQSIPASRVLCSVVLNPTLTPAEFLETILIGMGIAAVPDSKARRLLFLQGVLLEADRLGRIPVLIIDEAHKISPEVLEEIRLLSNFEKQEYKLLQIVLAGQTELTAVLNREDLRQFKQRIAVRTSIHPLESNDVPLYLQHRWAKAGGKAGHPFSAEGVSRIDRFSRGFPRVMNAICANALMLAFARGVHAVGAAEIEQVARELDLPGPGDQSRLPTGQLVSSGKAVKEVFHAAAEPPADFSRREGTLLVRGNQVAQKRPSLFKRFLSGAESAG